MANIENFKRQHVDIRKNVSAILDIIDGQDMDSNINELTTHINILSGRLLIHLSTEDKFLYPDLLNSTSIEIKKLAEKYIQEMSGLANKFNDFKNRFNTKSKINSDKNTFIIELKAIFKLLEERLNREDRDLYPLLNQ